MWMSACAHQAGRRSQTHENNSLATTMYERRRKDARMCAAGGRASHDAVLTCAVMGCFEARVGKFRRCLAN